MTKPRRKRPRVLSKTLRRMGNHSANPYPAPELRHEDRKGWPFSAQPNRDGPPGPFKSTMPQKTDLSDEAQLGKPEEEPTYVLRASSPFSGMVMRFMVNASIAFDLLATEREAIRKAALAMDEWRKNRGNTP